MNYKQLTENERYLIEGEWDEVIVDSAPPILEWSE